MPKLYYHPYSQHSRRVVALLAEAGLDWDKELVDLATGQHMSPDYLAINPNHQVPTLIDDDIKIHESNAIMRYICNRHELSSWYPDDVTIRALIDQWMDWGQCRLGPAVIDIVYNTVFAGDAADKAAIKRGHEKMAELIPILEAGLADSDFLAGHNPTIADIAIWANIFHLTLAGALPSTPNISRWFGTMMVRPACQQALPPQEDKKSA